MGTKTDYKTLPSEEVQALLLQKKRELMNLRFRHSAGELSNTHIIRATKKEVARILTHISKRAENA